MNIKLHIERLVLDGLNVSRHQAHGIQSAVETELARLLETHGLARELSQNTSIHRLQAPRLDLPALGVPTIGNRIAGAVHHVIGGSGRLNR